MYFYKLYRFGGEVAIFLVGKSLQNQSSYNFEIYMNFLSTSGVFVNLRVCILGVGGFSLCQSTRFHYDEREMRKFDCKVALA